MSKAIAYILNPEKTDEKLLVSSYGCASETAAREFEWTRKIAEQKGMNPVRIIARHVIQSFEIGEVTPELAHEIGKQFADEILGGKYEYVLTTHIDKDHVHNHLIFNAVDFVDYHAYKSYKRIYYDMREISDRLCKENGLSVIPPSQNKGMGYKEYTEAKRGTSWKQKLKQTIDRLVITAKDYDDFLRLMQEAGYEIKTGKYISFRAEGQERFTRSKTIGENYTEERIKERIAGRTPRRSQRQATPKGISLIGDIQEQMCIRDRYIDDRYVDEHTDSRSERLRRMSAFRMEEPMPCEASVCEEAIEQLMPPVSAAAAPKKAATLEMCIRDRILTVKKQRKSRLSWQSCVTVPVAFRR